MKNKIIITGILMAGICYGSCEKKNDDGSLPAPVVILNELGYENSMTAYAGSDLHIEAEIVAEGKIDKVSIDIHPEGGHAKSFLKTLQESEWVVDTTYTGFSGLKNTILHEHLDIPADADTGHYHFHLIVTDLEGQQTIVEEELEILHTPVKSLIVHPVNNQ